MTTGAANMIDMPGLLLGYALPAAYDLLPDRMSSAAADAMLLAIALQESRCTARRQLPNGPAHGFFQFERGGGVAGVLSHRTTRPIVLQALRVLCYPDDAQACYVAIEHNDILAAVFARLLLWTLPAALPRRSEHERGWQQYLEAWRPGRPHRETFDAFFDQAWELVS